MLKNKLFFAFCIVLLLSSCTASRTVIHSGKVTPKGDIKLGLNQSANIPTQTLTATSQILISAAKNAIARDSIRYNEHIDNFSKALVAYSLDPLNTNLDFYVRYGLLKRVDVGYKYFFGAHVFDAMFQFMGSTGTINNPGEEGMSGSVGIQYSSQRIGLPDMFYLDRLSEYLMFSAERKDIMIPIVFSAPLGKEEEYGHLGFGAVYNHTFIDYNFAPARVIMNYAGMASDRPLPSFGEKKNFPSFGLFFNGKFGYKYVYFLGSLSMFYQNYGTYRIPGLYDNTVKLSGLTFIPSMGLQFHIHSGKGSKKQE